MNDIIKTVLKTYDPIEFGDKDGAQFVTMSTYFQSQKTDMQQHRKGLKKVDANYFKEQEKREEVERKKNSMFKDYNDMMEE